ncbi:hypothetical protein FO519_001249 [Halicephalobus sp. NKZ332]|nr:hypothetical protein FO519_001249 [Halicephalobus sp. NKZ332]
MLTYLLVLIFVPLLVTGNAVPTKLCGDEKCSQKLFSTTAVRPYGANHADFLTLKENETIEIYAIKMSNRPDIVEGVNSEGKRGLLYLNFVDRLGYIFYLMKIVEDNEEMFEVKQVVAPGEAGLVKKRSANPYLHEEVKPPEVVPPEDPLKKISLQAMKEAQKNIPDVTSTPPTVAPPSPVEPPAPAEPEKASESNVVEENLKTEQLGSAEERKISPDLVNSIIEEIDKNSQEIIPEDPKPSELNNVDGKKDEVVPPIEEVKIDPVTIPPVEEVKIDPVTIPPVEEIKTDPVTTPPVEESLNVNPPTIPPVEESMKIDEGTVPPVEETTNAFPTTIPDPITTTERLETAVPTTAPMMAVTEAPEIHTHGEQPVTSPPEIPQQLPSDIHVEDLLTTPSPNVEELPNFEELPTSTPAPVEEKQNAVPYSEELKSSSVLQEEIRSTGSKMDEYCYNDDCSRNSDNSNASEPTGFIATSIRPIARSVAYNIRSASFYPVNQFDDTGIFVLLFFLFTFVLYIFNWLFQDGGKKDILDRRALHDALTRVKEQQVQIDQLKKNSADPQTMAQYTGQIEKLRNDCMHLKQENDKLNYAIQQKQAEYTEIAQEKSRFQSDFQQVSTEKAGLQRELENLVQEKNEIYDELKMVKEQLEKVNKNQADSISEIQVLTKEKDELEESLHEKESEVSKLKANLDNANQKINDLEGQLESRKKTEEEYIEIIDELQKKLTNAQQKPNVNKNKVESVGSGESNASNGWSDMDLGDLDVPEEKNVEEEQLSKKPVKVATLGKKNKKEKEPSPEQERKISTTKGSDFMELVNLRKELKCMEVERDELKRELHSEKKMKELIEFEIDQLKKNLTEKKSDLERTTADKDYFRTQSEALQQKLEEASYKIEKLQQDKEKMFDLEKEIIRLSGERSEASIRIKDLEKQLNRAEDDNKKIELRFFTEQRRLQNHILNLENKALTANVHDGIGSGNSSDRDFSLGGTNNGQTNSEIRSLWTDVDAETSFDDGLIPSDSRRKSRGFYDQIPSGRRSTGRDFQRRRSRSAGRNKGSGVSSPNFLPQPFSHNSSRASPMNSYDRHGEHRSSKRVSRGNQNALYYSSDGSNGLSPPPEMPSQSGIAPSTVLLHKPTPRT